MRISPIMIIGLLASGFSLTVGATPGEGVRPGQSGPVMLLAVAHSSLSAPQSGNDVLAASKYTRTAACLPAGGVSQAEVLIAAVTYLKEHPGHQGLPPGAVLSNALRLAYPCPR